MKFLRDNGEERTIPEGGEGQHPMDHSNGLQYSNNNDNNNKEHRHKKTKWS